MNVHPAPDNDTDPIEPPKNLEEGRELTIVPLGNTEGHYHLTKGSRTNCFGVDN